MNINYILGQGCFMGAVTNHYLITTKHNITLHLLSIEHADWSKLQNLFKASDATTRQHQFLASPCAFYSATFIHDGVTRIESRCVIKAKHDLATCRFIFIALHRKNCIVSTEALVQFFMGKQNELTRLQHLFFCKMRTMHVNLVMQCRKYEKKVYQNHTCPSSN